MSCRSVQSKPSNAGVSKWLQSLSDKLDASQRCIKDSSCEGDHECEIEACPHTEQLESCKVCVDQIPHTITDQSIAQDIRTRCYGDPAPGGSSNGVFDVVAITTCVVFVICFIVLIAIGIPAITKET